MRLRKGLLYVFIATFINLLVNIVSGFLLPKYLSIDTYAQIALYQLYITYVGILHLGFSDGIYLKYGGIDPDKINPQSLYGELKTFKLFQLLLGMLAVIVCLFIDDKLLLICALSILPINMANYLRNIYQATGQFKKYARFTNVNTLLILLINIILLFIIKSDYYLYYIVAYLLIWVAYWVFLEREMGKIIKRSKAKASIAYFKENIKEGYSLMLGNFSVVFLGSVDRLFVKKLMGLTQFAFYSFAVNLQSLINVFIMPIATVMYNFFSKHREREKVMLVKNVMLLLAAVFISGTFLIRIIVEKFIPEYIPSLEVVFILFAAQFFIISIRTVFTNLYKVLRRQKRYLSVVVVTTLLAIILIPSLYLIFPSMAAIASAMLMASFVWFLICEYDFKEYRYTAQKIIFISIVVSVFLLTGLFLEALTGLLIYVIILLIAIALLMKDEYKYLRSEVGSMLKKMV